MKIVINKCWGGYGLSHKAVMRYAELAGFELYPFTEARKANGDIDFKHFEPYIESEKDPFIIHYSKMPLKADGQYEKDSYWSDDNIARNDPILIQVIEELKEEADGPYAKLVIRDVPDDIEYEIDDYDGMESIHEKHRSW